MRVLASRRLSCVSLDAMTITRAVAVTTFLFIAHVASAVEPADLVGEYVREGEYERLGVRLALSADYRWLTLKPPGERDIPQGIWRIAGSRLLLLKDGSTDWEAAGNLTILPVSSSFVLVQDYDARKSLEEHHYFKRHSPTNDI